MPYLNKLNTSFEAVSMGIIIDKNEYTLGWMFGERSYKLQGFKSFMAAKLAALNLYIIFWPNLAALAVNQVMQCRDPRICSEFRMMLPTLLDEANGKLLSRVKIKTNIIRPQIFAYANQKDSTIADAAQCFALATKAADEFTNRKKRSFESTAPMLFTPIPATVRPSTYSAYDEIEMLCITDKNEHNETEAIEIPDRMETISRFSFPDELPADFTRSLYKRQRIEG